VKNLVYTAAAMIVFTAVLPIVAAAYAQDSAETIFQATPRRWLRD
jgi:hypothetical protein